MKGAGVGARVTQIRRSTEPAVFRVRELVCDMIRARLLSEPFTPRAWFTIVHDQRATNEFPIGAIVGVFR